MAKNKHKNEIELKDNEWIKYIDAEAKLSEAINIDNILNSSMPFIDRLETNCIAGCCGLDAYDFSVGNIKKAINEDRFGYNKDSIMTAINEIKKLNSEIVLSQRMNNYIYRDALVKILNHIQSTFTSISKSE